MNRFDFTPYRRSTVGFDRLFDLLENNARAQQSANRNFERRFELADFVRVENAELADGLLVIDLVREIPEAMRPQTIAINKGDNVTKIVDKRNKQEDKAA